MSTAANLLGKKFSRLTVIRREGIIWESHAAWFCECECGGTTITSSHALTAGHKRSCGCLEKENNDSLFKHGHYGTRTYRIWVNMKTRCTNPSNRFFYRYGGRGITMCDKWQDFEGFYDDMGACPDGMTIERINNDLGYSADNCRWATMKDQANNRKSNIKIEIDGVTKNLKEWSEHFGVKYCNVYSRYKQGLPQSEWFIKGRRPRTK